MHNFAIFRHFVVDIAFFGCYNERVITRDYPRLRACHITRRCGGIIMFDFIFTRKDGHAFGLERSGFKVATKVKDRQTVTTQNCCITSKGNRAIQDNPLLFKKVRHG